MLILDGLLTILPVTFSSLSIALVLLVLLGTHGVAAAWALVAGWFAASWAVLALAMLGVSGLAGRSGGAPVTLPPLAQVGVGAGAVVLGLVLLVRRARRAGHPGPELARLARLADGLTPMRSALLGFVLVGLSVRQWLFLVPAAGFFAAADATGGVLWLPVLGAAVASLGVLAPVLLAAWSQRTDPQYLRRVRRWWMREGDTVGAVVAVLVGTVLAVVGLLRL
jgi:hypothetical protein